MMAEKVGELVVSRRGFGVVSLGMILGGRLAQAEEPSSVPKEPTPVPEEQISAEERVTKVLREMKDELSLNGRSDVFKYEVPGAENLLIHVLDKCKEDIHPHCRSVSGRDNEFFYEMTGIFYFLTGCLGVKDVFIYTGKNVQGLKEEIRNFSRPSVDDTSFPYRLEWARQFGALGYLLFEKDIGVIPIQRRQYDQSAFRYRDVALENSAAIEEMMKYHDPVKVFFGYSGNSFLPQVKARKRLPPGERFSYMAIRHWSVDTPGWLANAQKDKKM